MTTQTVTIDYLEEVANDFLEEEFGLTLEVPITISNRFTRTLGCVRMQQNRVTGYLSVKEITMSGNLIKYYNHETVIDVLKHECVHYALFHLGKPYRDGDAYFENTLKRLGITRTGVIEHKGKAHVYVCKECDSKVVRERRFNVNIYRCGRCKTGRFEYLKQTVR